MVLLMQCFVENVLKLFFLQDIVMSTQEVQNNEENEKKKKCGHRAETLKDFPPGSYISLYWHDLQILSYYNYYLNIHFVIWTCKKPSFSWEFGV